MSNKISRRNFVLSGTAAGLAAAAAPAVMAQAPAVHTGTSRPVVVHPRGTAS